MMKELFDFKLYDKGYDEYSNIKHLHEGFYEILFIRTGTGSMLIKDKISNFKPYFIYFIDGGDVHCSVPDNADEYCRSKIIISRRFIDNLAYITGCTDVVHEVFNNGNNSGVLLDEKAINRIHNSFVEINNAMKQADKYTKIIVSYSVMKIICTYHSQQKQDIFFDDKQISDILEYVNKNLNLKFQLEDISSEMHISKYYLCHIFKKRTGITIFEYIVLRRLSIAKKYLLSTDMSISDISLKTGFSSFSYFGKIFKKYEGITPSEYRRVNMYR